MLRYKCLPILALLIHSIACETFKCGENIGPNCVCYAETLQVVCADTAEKKLEASDLVKIGANITGDGNLLYIHSAETLTEISKNTFSAATFAIICIERNSLLENIDKEAFKASTRTEILAVRRNPKLRKSGLFDIALTLSSSLHDVEFHENSIENFDNAFNDAKFANIAYVRLDGQHIDAISLKTQSFGKLPKLKELSLYNKKVSIVKIENQSVIDLSATTTTGRVSILLQNSQLETVDGLLDHLNNNNVGLNLENNKLKSIPKLCEEIAAANGTCFLAGNTVTLSANCKCSDVQNLKKILLDDPTKDYIWGLIDVTCEGKKITDCSA